MRNIKLQSDFWGRYQNLVSKNVIPYQWNALNDRLSDAEPSHAVKNFKIAAGLEEGEYYGEVFQDSDIAKWIETVSFSLLNFPNEELENTVDELIDIIALAQEKDGYLNTYYQLKSPENKWKNLRDNHELYCGGHFIEAAVTYYNVTGKRKLLEVMEKFVVLVNQKFGSDNDKLHGYPGHEEIELALLKMYDVTSNPMHLELAKYFIEERGKQPNYFDYEKEERKGEDLTWNDDNNVNFGLGYEYQQAHKPIREQDKAVGHAVRAVYYYTAVADLADKIDDLSLKRAVKNLWSDIIKYQMYITGGIGSSAVGESFTCHHDLPNDSMYCETCASVGLAFFADKMQKIEVSNEFGDVFEKLIYNGTISGMNLDGNRFFYVNPLEINPFQKNRKDQEHVVGERQKWLKTACCPPNLARFIASMNQYILTEKDNQIIIHQYIGSDFYSENNEDFEMNIISQLPWEGKIELIISTVEEVKKNISLRIPNWTKNNFLVYRNDVLIENPTVTNGYLNIEEKWKGHSIIRLEFDMTPKLIYANRKISNNVGKVAIQRGPIIYAIEEVDNGNDLSSLYVKDLNNVQIKLDDDLYGANILKLKGYKLLDESEDTYHDEGIRFEEIPIIAVPYYSWGNRGYGEMKVWINKL